MTVIAIDGPAASGKSSVSRKVAARLGYTYVSSGAMYRALTWHVLHSGIDSNSPAAVAEVMAKTQLECLVANQAATLFINGQNYADHAGDEIVTHNVSQVSSVPELRAALLSHLRALEVQNDLVMEGRDIGSVVFPDTPYKFYLDASPDERRRRRAAQGIIDEITVRDRLDSTRASAPLTLAEDALVIDSTHLTADGVVGEIIGRLKLRGLVVPHEA